MLRRQFTVWPGNAITCVDESSHLVRATERQRGSGYKLRRQFTAWPGNAITVRSGQGAASIEYCCFGPRTAPLSRVATGWRPSAGPARIQRGPPRSEPTAEFVDLSLQKVK